MGKMFKVVRIKKYFKENFVIIKAAAIFFAALIFFFWILNNGWAIEHIIDPFTTAVAFATSWIFKLAGQTVGASGKTVSVNGTTLSIAIGCNGAEAMALYFSAILAYPTSWLRKLAGLGLGFMGIFLINQVRVVGLFLVAMYKPGILPEAHNYAGQTFVIVMGMALWFFWAEKYAGFSHSKDFAAVR